MSPHRRFKLSSSLEMLNGKTNVQIVLTVSYSCAQYRSQEVWTSLHFAKLAMEGGELYSAAKFLSNVVQKRWQTQSETDGVQWGREWHWSAHESLGRRALLPSKAMCARGSIISPWTPNHLPLLPDCVLVLWGTASSFSITGAAHLLWLPFRNVAALTMARLNELTVS